jgi:lantibiotic biosynthesis protein
VSPPHRTTHVRRKLYVGLPSLNVWQPLIQEEDSTRAAEVAIAIAKRLNDPSVIERAVANSFAQTRYFSWSGYGFASGFAGSTLLWAHLDRCYPDKGWDALAHDCLSAAVRDLESVQYPSPSLFGGLAGIGFAANYAARGRSRYNGLLRKLDGYIVALTASNVSFFFREEQVFGAPVELFDLISGLSGTLIYLLSRYGSSSEINEVVERVVGCLVKLGSEKNGVPVCHTPKTFLRPYDTMTDSFPNGHVNCGLAHGIPGPLGAMALAKISGVKVDGLADSIAYLATWLLEHRHDDSWGINWPSGVALRMELGDVRLGSPADSAPSFSGWCYGSPGISRSIFLSGLALNRGDLCASAVQSAEATLRRPNSARALYSPTFCHGTAGLLQIVIRYLNEAPTPSLQTEFHNILEGLLKQYNQDSLLGFQSRTSEGAQVDSPALLDGAAGVALVLLSVRRDVEPAWDRAFLLS